MCESHARSLLKAGDLKPKSLVFFFKTLHFYKKNIKVTLDVGGRLFKTSLDTLRMREESMLARMFSGQFLIEEKVPTFIDRDGTHFPFILNFLRDGRVDLPVDDLTKRQLVQEARFYSLPKLERQLTRGLWTVGTKIDVLNSVRKWRAATIKEVTETSFLISWSKKWKWLSKDSHRLGTRTLLPKKNRFFFS